MSDAETSNSSSASSRPEPIKKTKEDFTFLNIIGEGSFSTVHLAKEISSGKLFASNADFDLNIPFFQNFI